MTSTYATPNYYSDPTVHFPQMGFTPPAASPTPPAHAPATSGSKSMPWVVGGVMGVMGLAVLALGGGWSSSAQDRPTPAAISAPSVQPQPIEVAAAAPPPVLQDPRVVSAYPTYVGGSPATVGAPQGGQPTGTPNVATVAGPVGAPGGAPRLPSDVIVTVRTPPTTAVR